MSSQNVQLRGGQKNNFTNVSEDSHLDTQSSFLQFTSPVRVQFPYPLSGPVQLENIPCAYVEIQNLAGNDPIYVGGIGDQAPYIDKNYVGDYRGVIIYERMTWRFDVINSNLLSVIGTSQQSFTYYAVPNVKTQVTTTNTSPPAPLNLAPLSVVSTNPANGATNIATTVAPYAIFNKPVDPTTVNTTNVAISPNVAHSASADPSNAAKIILTPTSALANATTYTITYSGLLDTSPSVPIGMTPSSSSFSFTTAAVPDTTKPTVSSVTPANAATNIAINGTNVVIVFSKAMDSTTINNTNISLNHAMTGTVSLSADKTTATYTPNTALTNSTTYTVTVTTAVKDTAGNAMASTFTSTFTTVAAAPPTVSSTTPANNETGDSISTNITVVFSQQMNSATIIAANLYISSVTEGTISSGVSLASDKVTATISPNNTLKYSTQYTITATTACKNLAGTGLASNFTAVFTTTAPSYTQIFNHADDGNIAHVGTNTGGSAIASEFGAYLPTGYTSALQGHIPRKWTWKMKRVGSPTGTMYMRIVTDAHDYGVSGHIGATIGQIDVSTISTSATNYTFENPNNTVALDKNTWNGLVVDYNGGDSSNYIAVYRDNSGGYDGDATQTFYWQQGAFVYSTRDPAGTGWE